MSVTAGPSEQPVFLEESDTESAAGIDFIKAESGLDNPEAEPDQTVFTQTYIVRDGEMFAAEANEDDGTSTEIAFSDGLSDELKEMHQAALAQALGGEEASTEIRGVAGHTDTTETFVISTYRLTGETPDGLPVIEVESRIEERKIPSGPEESEDATAEDFYGDTLEDYAAEPGDFFDTEFALPPLPVMAVAPLEVVPPHPAEPEPPEQRLVPKPMQIIEPLLISDPEPPAAVTQPTETTPAPGLIGFELPAISAYEFLPETPAGATTDEIISPNEAVRTPAKPKLPITPVQQSITREPAPVTPTPPDPGKPSSGIDSLSPPDYAPIQVTGSTIQQSEALIQIATAIEAPQITEPAIINDIQPVQTEAPKRVTPKRVTQTAPSAPISINEAAPFIPASVAETGQVNSVEPSATQQQPAKEVAPAQLSEPALEVFPSYETEETQALIETPIAAAQVATLPSAPAAEVAAPAIEVAAQVLEAPIYMAEAVEIPAQSLEAPIQMQTVQAEIPAIGTVKNAAAARVTQSPVEVSEHEEQAADIVPPTEAAAKIDLAEPVAAIKPLETTLRAQLQDAVAEVRTAEPEDVVNSATDNIQSTAPIATGFTSIETTATTFVEMPVTFTQANAAEIEPTTKQAVKSPRRAIKTEELVSLADTPAAEDDNLGVTDRNEPAHVYEMPTARVDESTALDDDEDAIVIEFRPSGRRSIQRPGRKVRTAAA